MERQAPPMPTIRPYQPGDHAALHEICVRTGLGGDDATGHYRDPRILPVIFAAPYAELDPELVFVVDDGGSAVGYVVGTADTEAFVTAFRAEWLPRYAERYPKPAEPFEDLDAVMANLLHTPERMRIPELAEYPAHLHIDLLPDYQGRGLGRRLMHTLWEALRARGVPGIHLTVSAENTSARAFYHRLGYREVPVPGRPETVRHLGYRL